MVKANPLNSRFRNPLATSIICKSSKKISIVIFVVLAGMIVDTLYQSKHSGSEFSKHYLKLEYCSIYYSSCNSNCRSILHSRVC